MVRRAVSARVEDHVCGHAEYPGGGDTGDRAADHGSDGLLLPQHPRIQSEVAGWPLSKGRFAGRIVVRRPRRDDGTRVSWQRVSLRSHFVPWPMRLARRKIGK